jgi:hypothetical protein
MGGNNGGYGMNQPPGNNQMNPNNMVNFNTSMHSVQVGQKSVLRYRELYNYIWVDYESNIM